MDYHYLFTEFNFGTARQACLNVEVRMRTKYCLSERRRLEYECERQADLLKVRDGEIENLKAQLLLKEAEAAEAARLRIQDSLNGKITELKSMVSANDLELKDLNVVVSSLKSPNDKLMDQDAQIKVLDDKVAKLDVDLLEMALHLEENFYPHLLTTISGRRWLLTCGLKLNVVKCLNSLEYLTALGSAISHAIEKGMQSGLSAGIDHEKADQVVLGETSLSFASSVSHSQVERIRENVAVQRSALIDVWVPLVKPLSSKNLMGATCTFGSMLAAIATTTTLSTTFASTSSIPPITIDDYEIISADGQEDAQGNIYRNSQGNVASFLMVEFEEEELDTTP
ncbi:hypothetical protein Tco_0861644 [Tanacetum coccineum]|uniref:Uncharacterized protein n=1 Tax=Tanacetum coccineum TaxID=301880 RepID=A0ABQ5BLA5_9ASTR